jgi:hypothetical protein
VIGFATTFPGFDLHVILAHSDEAPVPGEGLRLDRDRARNPGTKKPISTGRPGLALDPSPSGQPPSRRKNGKITFV